MILLPRFFFLIVSEGLAGVSRKADETGFLKSLEVGSKKVNVNLLQHADDKLFSVKRILKVCLSLRLF